MRFILINSKYIRYTALSVMIIVIIFQSIKGINISIDSTMIASVILGAAILLYVVISKNRLKQNILKRLTDE